MRGYVDLPVVRVAVAAAVASLRFSITNRSESALMVAAPERVPATPCPVISTALWRGWRVRGGLKR